MLFTDLLELASIASIYRQLSDGNSSPDEATTKIHGSSYDAPTRSNSLDDAVAVGAKHRAARPTTTRLTQFQTLSHREFLNLKRDWSLVVMHNAVAIVVGLFVGGLYFQVDTTIAGFQNRIGSLFFIGALVAFSALSALSNLFTIRPLFLRERTSAYYGPVIWMLSRAVWDIIPLRLLPTVLLGTIVYWMVGLSPDAARFFKVRSTVGVGFQKTDVAAVPADIDRILGGDHALEPAAGRTDTTSCCRHPRIKRHQSGTACICGLFRQPVKDHACAAMAAMA